LSIKYQHYPAFQVHPILIGGHSHSPAASV